MCSDEDPGETDAHLDGPEARPQQGPHTPVRRKGFRSRTSLNLFNMFLLKLYVIMLKLKGGHRTELMEDPNPSDLCIQ